MGWAFALVVVTASVAFAQETPAPSPTVVPEPGPPASYYASYGLVIIAGLLLLAALAGYLIQAPGFRRHSRRGGTASEGE